MFQSLWKACGIFEVFLREAAQRPPGRLPISGAYIVSCWKRAICRRTIVSTLRSRLPRKSRQPLRFAQIAVNSCSARRPRRRDSGRSNQPFFRTQVAAAIADTEFENSGIAAAPTPCQRMRFSQSKLDRQANRQKASHYRRLSKLGRERHPATKPVSPPLFSRSQVTFVGSLSSLLQNRRCRREWKTRDPRRVRLSTSNLSQRCETIRNIAAKLPRNRTAPMVSRGLVPDDVRETL